jgi:hypothetical protein
MTKAEKNWDIACSIDMNRLLATAGLKIGWDVQKKRPFKIAYTASARRAIQSLCQAERAGFQWHSAQIQRHVVSLLKNPKNPMWRFLTISEREGLAP